MSEERNTLLIVDDNEANRNILKSILEKNYTILEAENGEQAMLLMEQYHHSLGCLLLDLEMPVKNGFEVMEAMAQKNYMAEIPVLIIVTAEDTQVKTIRAFEAGAYDILRAPFDPNLVKHRINNAIEMNMEKLSRNVIIQTQANEIRESSNNMIDVLSSALEYRSFETGIHVQRIRAYTKALLQEIARDCPEYRLTSEDIEVMSSASSLHDIGKIAIPDAILNKPGPLTAAEFEVMKTHTTKGADIVSLMDAKANRVYLKAAYNIARYHHERWDGKGYPDHLCRDNIPIGAQAVSICDCFDALTNDRVYKKALSAETAYAMILHGDCGAFSPRLLACFANVRPAFESFCSRFFAQEGDGVAQSLYDEKATLERHRNDFVWHLPQDDSYGSLLRYVNSTIVALNFTLGSFDLIYDANGFFSEFASGGHDFSRILDFITTSVAADDQQVLTTFLNSRGADFFAQGLQRVEAVFNIKGKDGKSYKFDANFMASLTSPPSIHCGILILSLASDISHNNASFSTDVSVDPTLLKDFDIAQFVTSSTVPLELYSGSQSLAKFFKVTLDSFLSQTKGKFLNLIPELERGDFLRQTNEQFMSRSSFQCESHLVFPGKEPIWALESGRSFIDSDGRGKIVWTLIDISAEQRSLQNSADRLRQYEHTMTLCQSAFFQYDPKTQQTTFSPSFQEIFGLGSPLAIVGPSPFNSSMIPPSDDALLRKAIQDVLSGVPSVKIQIRLGNMKKNLVWYQINLAASFDYNENIQSVVGILSEADAEHHQLETYRERAEKDPLTGLLNRNIARERVGAAFQGSHPHEGAFIFFDVDDFKAVNDRFGHLVGDFILQRIAHTLQSYCHGADILSRFGGDEFLVYVPSTSTVSLLEDAVKEFLARLNDNMPHFPDGKTITLSYGISLFPKDGTTFESLFRKADMALYSVKVHGKGSVAFYKDSMRFNPFESYHPAPLSDVPPVALSTPDIIPLASDNGISFIFKRTIKADFSLRDMNDLLRELCEHIHAESGFLFIDLTDGKSASALYSYSPEGAKATIGQGSFPYARLSDFFASFDHNGIFCCPNTSFLSEDLKDFFQKAGVDSFFAVRLLKGTARKGFLFFANSQIDEYHASAENLFLQEVGTMISCLLFH